MKKLSKFLVLGMLVAGLGAGMVPSVSVYADENNTANTQKEFIDGIVLENTTSDSTVTENYLFVTPSIDDVLRYAPKSIKVSGDMLFDKQGWGYGPPSSRNWKEKHYRYWYYGKLYLQSYKSAGNLWIARYAGTLTRH